MFSPRKVIIAPDSFKGCLTADEVSRSIAEGLRQISPLSQPIIILLSDGGEGFGEIFNKRDKVKTECFAEDPLGRLIKTDYYIIDNGETAVIESAKVCGLGLLSPEERNPMKASSFGLGQLIKDAIGKGCKKIMVGLGGSAVNDGGTGMLSALGYEFYDRKGNLLKGKGEDLSKIYKISSPNVMPDVEFQAVCDVKNPLLGSEGATYVYSFQKGADMKMADSLEKGMENYAKVCKDFLRKDFSVYAGTGAAGGLGFAIKAFFDGIIKEGIDVVMEANGFEEALHDADLIITGEGSIDRQSLMGKVLDGVCKRAKKFGIPVIALGGKVKDAEIIEEAGVIPLCINSLSGFEDTFSSPLKAKEAIRLTIINLFKNPAPSSLTYPL